MNFLNIDYGIIFLYLLICLGIGFINRKRSDTIKEFSFYRNISLSALVCTLFASSIGAGSSMGDASNIYKFGIIYAISQLFMSLWWALSIFVIAPGINKFKDCLTISDVMGKLYGRTGEIVSAFLVVIGCIGALSVQALVLGKVFHYFLGISKNVGIWVSYFVIIAYSVLGGIRAVIYNDIFKSVIVFLVLPLACVSTVSYIGGVETILPKLPSSHLVFDLNNANMLLLIGFVFSFILPSFDAELVQRYLMAKDVKQLRQAFLWIFVFSFFFSLSIPVIAYVVKAAAPDINPDDAFLYFINHFMPVGVKGLMIAGLMAIIMSMAEAKLNSGALVAYKNLLSHLIEWLEFSEKQKLNILKGIICFLAIVSILLVDISKGNDILYIFWLVNSFSIPIIFVPAIAGFIGFKTNNLSFKISTMTTLLTVILVGLYFGEFTTINSMWGLIACALSFFGTHYLQIATGRIQYFKQALNIIEYSEVKRLWNNWRLSIQLEYNKQEEDEPKYLGFLIFAFIFELLYFANMIWHGEFSATLLVLLSICHFLCLIMALRETLFATERMKNILPLYFRMALVITLPTLSSYILFTHSQYNFWLIMGILSAFSLGYITDALRAIVYYTVGMIIAYIIIVITGEVYSTAFSIRTILFIYAYFIFTSYSIVRWEERIRETKLDNMHLFGSAVAHEVRSPLASLNMCAQMVHSIVQEHNKGGEIIIKNEDAKMLLEMSDSMMTVSTRGVKTVEALLAAIRKDISTHDIQLLNMSDIAKNSIEEFCLFSGKREKISLIIKQDFQLHCSMQYMKYVLINLLKNSFRHGGSKVLVEVIVEQGKIIVRDDGHGIAEESLPYIFERFYTKSENGIGIGLAFCKMVVEKMKGTIECYSQQDLYTEFIITFPNLSE